MLFGFARHRLACLRQHPFLDVRIDIGQVFQDRLPRWITTQFFDAGSLWLAYPDRLVRGNSTFLTEGVTS